MTAGLVNAHTHLYSGLAPFGIPAPEPPPQTFVQILERLWWRLDRALDEPTLHDSARYYVAEALLHVLRDVDERLDRPPVLDLVDVGAGQGELLTALVRLAGADLGPRLRPPGVDLLTRPAGLGEPGRCLSVVTR